MFPKIQQIQWDHEKFLQNEVFVPGRVKGSGLVAGVVPGQRVGSEVERAEGVTASGHVFADQISGLQDL